MNTRFSVAAHVLTLLAARPDEPLTSEFIAGSVGTNAVVIRRILGLLREAGFVRTAQGPGGGFTLAADPARLTLRDVYVALEERDVIGLHEAPNPRCPVGRNIGTLLERVINGAQKAMLDSLRDTSIAMLARKVERCESGR